MTPSTYRCPPGMSRDEWITALCEQFPSNAQMIRDAADDWCNREKMPALRIVYREKDDYVYGTQPPHKEFVRAFTDLVWEPIREGAVMSG